jgi:hypothetical protein
LGRGYRASLSENIPRLLPLVLLVRVVKIKSNEAEDIKK